MNVEETVPTKIHEEDCKMPKHSLVCRRKLSRLMRLEMRHWKAGEHASRQQAMAIAFSKWRKWHGTKGIRCPMYQMRGRR